MAGVIQVGDIIKFSEIAWTVWNYGWASESNAGDNYHAFGADVRTLHKGLKSLDDAVTEVQRSLREHGAENSDILGGDKTSLLEIIGDYEQTLKDCHQFLAKNRRYDQTTGPARNIDWNINIIPQVEHLRGRIQMHNARIQHVIRPFQIDLINKIHKDLVRRLTSLHKDVLGIRRDIHTVLVKYYPEVAKEIEQQSEQELYTIKIPESLIARLATMFDRRARRRMIQPLTLQELTDCFLVRLGRSTVIVPPGPEYFGQCAPLACYVELLKCQLIMQRIKNSNELQNPPPRISHWPGYIDVLEEKLSQQCSRFQSELIAPDTSDCPDELLTFWPEDEQNTKKPQQAIGSSYNYLLEVSLAPESDPTTWKMMRLLRKNGSDRHFRIIEAWGYNDQLSTEEPTVVDFNIDTAALIPIYAEPADKDGMPPPLEIIIEDNDKSYRYVFLDIHDLLLFQEAITGFKVMANYTESRAIAIFVKSGGETPLKENVTVQLWLPSNVKGFPEKDGGGGYRRPSSWSQASVAPTIDSPSRTNSIVSSPSTAAVSCRSWSSSESDDTISLKIGGAAANTGHGVIRPRPRSPLLVLFTRDSESSKRSIVAIKVDDETVPNPERCNCHRSRDCRIAALEQKYGRFHTQRLEHRAKWNLLPLQNAPVWGGLLRVSILFPSPDARYKFSGGYCGCKAVTESDIDRCLSNSHQGLLGIARVYYRRQMIMWQEQRDKQKEADLYPPSGFFSFSLEKDFPKDADVARSPTTSSSKARRGILNESWGPGPALSQPVASPSRISSTQMPGMPPSYNNVAYSSHQPSAPGQPDSYQAQLDHQDLDPRDRSGHSLAAKPWFVQGIAPNDKVNAEKSPGTEDHSHNLETRRDDLHTDSGYASTAHDNFGHAQKVQAEYHTQITEEDQSLRPSDRKYGSAPKNACESAQSQEELILDDVQTVYSDISSIPAPKEERYKIELANDLFSKVGSEQPDDQTMERISEILPELLKAFALKVGHTASTQMHRDIMVFIHKYRSDIVGYFNDRCCQEKELIPNAQTNDPDKIPLNDVMSRWYKTQDGLEDDIPSGGMPSEAASLSGTHPNSDIDDLVNLGLDEELEEEGNKESGMPEIPVYRDFIFETPAYEWLLTRLRREFLLAPTELNSMEAIRQEIINFLPTSHEVSRKKSAEAYKLTFDLRWDPLTFVREQDYRGEPGEAVERAITLTGSTKGVQALTCERYLCQTWPSSGKHTIQLVKDVVNSGAGHQHPRDLPDKTKLTAWINGPKFMVEVFGTGDSVAEIGEQLAWLGAALRSSPYEIGVAYCTPFINDIRIESGSRPMAVMPSEPDIICKIDFIVQRMEEHFVPTNGQCWHHMFRNPVVVKGYPIPRRSEPETGLEIPLNIIAGLVGTKFVNTFSGQAIIKGFSMMLVPTRSHRDILIWHLLYNDDGSHISYLDNAISHAGNISEFDLEKARHIVGWCSEVKYYAGAADAIYPTKETALREPHQGCILEKVSIRCAKLVTNGHPYAIGRKDTPVHISRDGNIPKLKWIHEQFVVLWDEEDKRGWLVNGTSALLHLLRASLEYDSHDEFSSVFSFRPEDMQEADIQHTGSSAINVLLNGKNMELKIYPEKGDYIRIKDRVEHLYEVLEKLITHQDIVSRQKTENSKPTPRRYLEGWDFRDLARIRDPVYPRVATLQAVGKGWVDFTRDINAVTLFGQGFGEIFLPAHTKLCAHQRCSSIHQINELINILTSINIHINPRLVV